LATAPLFYALTEILKLSGANPLFAQIPLAIGYLIGGFAYLKKEFGSKAIDLFKKYTSKHSYKELLGFQAEIEKELEVLLKCWIGKTDKKIILFVDDIDRCTEERIIQVIDSLKVMLENDEIAKRLIIITAIDETVLKRAIEYKYKNFMTDKKEDVIRLTREYMDKLFLVGIKLGNLNPEEKVEIFENYANGKIKPEEKITEKPSIGITVKSPITPETNNKPDEKALVVKTEPDSSHQDIGDPAAENNTEDNSDIIKALTNDKIECNENYEITSDERRNIVRFLRSDINLTPRDIRIFYNRYLLGKNLLCSLKLKSDRHYLWSGIEKEKGILAAMILEFSHNCGFQDIINEKKKLYENNGDVMIEERIMNEDFKIDGDLYIELLEVLEMIIPY
jgi:hypothetical protein